MPDIFYALIMGCAAALLIIVCDLQRMRKNKQKLDELVATLPDSTQELLTANAAQLEEWDADFFRLVGKNPKYLLDPAAEAKDEFQRNLANSYMGMLGHYRDPANMYYRQLEIQGQMRAAQQNLQITNVQVSGQLGSGIFFGNLFGGGH